MYARARTSRVRLSKFVVLDTSTPFSVIGAHFKPGGSFPFFGMPAGEFQDLHVPLEAVWGNDANNVQERLLRAKTRHARFRILEHALLQKSKGRLVKHPAVPYALKIFSDAEIPCSVADVTEQIGLSARRFIDVFRNEVGLSPKLYSRVRRFQKVLEAFQRIPDPDLTDTALSFGYFDQAHFIHEFRSFSGISPSAYLRHRPPHPNHVPILD
jgi:AraC-like DNA-binding protein